MARVRCSVSAELEGRRAAAAVVLADFQAAEQPSNAAGVTGRPMRPGRCGLPSTWGTCSRLPRATATTPRNWRRVLVRSPEVPARTLLTVPSALPWHEASAMRQMCLSDG